jgi:hypothetical protein
VLFKINTLFGHVIEEREDGVVVYQDDGSKVDGNNLRPCLGCNVKCSPGEHDPCIAGLPDTLNACCGHGVSEDLAGYVGLTDGRIIRFAGNLGGERIKAAVTAALAEQPLPEGFAVTEKAWWGGLSQEQVNLVHVKLPLYIAKVVEAVTGKTPTAFLEGDDPWWIGLSDEEKDRAWGLLTANHARFVALILERGPDAGAPDNAIVATEDAANEGARPC